jgi:hypothetical protein
MPAGHGIFLTVCTQYIRRVGKRFSEDQTFCAWGQGAAPEAKVGRPSREPQDYFATTSPQRMAAVLGVVREGAGCIIGRCE